MTSLLGPRISSHFFINSSSAKSVSVIAVTAEPASVEYREMTLVITADSQRAAETPASRPTCSLSRQSVFG